MRSYRDACGIARALDVVGDRWALLVIRDLLLGPKRFTDLRAGLPGVSPDVLSQRLRELEEAGLLARRRLPPPAASQVYDLTERGRALEPVLLELGRWGAGAPFPHDVIAFGPDAAVLALKTKFRSPADGFTADVELRLGERRFHARVAGGDIAVREGGADAPDATIATDPRTLAAVLWHDGDPSALGVSGEEGAAASFLALFR